MTDATQDPPLSIASETKTESNGDALQPHLQYLLSLTCLTTYPMNHSPHHVPAKFWRRYPRRIVITTLQHQLDCLNAEAFSPYPNTPVSVESTSLPHLTRPTTHHTHLPHTPFSSVQPTPTHHVQGAQLASLPVLPASRRHTNPYQIPCSWTTR